MLTQVGKQLSRFYGDREVKALLDTPFAIELIDHQVGISINGDSSRRARSEIFQYLADTGIFTHVVGHCLALAHHAMVSQENGPIFTLDHDSIAGSPSGIDRFAGSIEPGKDSLLSWLCLLRDVPLGLLRDMLAMLATVPGPAMPDIPAMSHKLPATGTSAHPPVFTFGWLGPEHSDPGRLDRPADHRGISWVCHAHAPGHRILGRAGGEEEGEGGARRRHRGGKGWRWEIVLCIHHCSFGKRQNFSRHRSCPWGWKRQGTQRAKV